MAAVTKVLSKDYVWRARQNVKDLSGRLTEAHELLQAIEQGERLDELKPLAKQLGSKDLLQHADKVRTERTRG